MGLQTQINLAIAAALSSALDLGEASYAPNIGANFNFADGGGDDQASQIFTDVRTLTASSTENLDLNGVLTNALGASIALTKVKALIIKADAANTNDVVVGPAASNGLVTPFNAAADRVKVKPGGLLVLVAPKSAGYAVTAGTGDQLFVGNGAAGTSVTYTIVVIGA
jgi:hypothetical protein